MTDAEIYDGLTDIFREQLRNPALVIQPGLGPADVPGWDSAAMVGIILAIEERFGIEFRMQDLRDVRTVGDFPRLIKRSGFGQDGPGPGGR